jgi:hypothetical protein
LLKQTSPTIDAILNHVSSFVMLLSTNQTFSILLTAILKRQTKLWTVTVAPMLFHRSIRHCSGKQERKREQWKGKQNYIANPLKKSLLDTHTNKIAHTNYISKLFPLNQYNNTLASAS